MFTTISLFFAGLGHVLAPLGAAGGMIAICLFLAYISPIGRKTCLWLAFVISMFMAGMLTGIHSEKARVEAQQAVIESAVDKAVKKAESKASKSTADPWDNRRY